VRSTPEEVDAGAVNVCGYTMSKHSEPHLTTSRASSTDITTWCQRSSLKCGTRGEIAVHTTPLWYAVKLSVESGIMSRAMKLPSFFT
jgi:hypothetical protein